MVALQFLLVPTILLITSVLARKPLDQQCYDPAYPIWSTNHIDAWCKYHDPSSTSQCAPVMWPAGIARPKMVTYHEKILQIMENQKPDIATREDCLARSSALNVDTQPNEVGLVEAVTCDLYSLNRRQTQECVCFPVYSDLIEPVPNDNMRTTTSVFYPPSQVVERALLVVAKETGPAVCTDCPATAKLLKRKSRGLDDFPYCAIPAPIAALPARTVVAAVATENGTVTTRTTTFLPLPTRSPDCRNETEYRTRAASACNLDLCMWSFVEPYTITTSSWATFNDERGDPNYMTWNRSASVISTQHWGVFPPLSKKNHYVFGKLVGHGQEFSTSSMASSYSECRTSLGLSAVTEKPHKKAEKRKRQPKPVCHDASNCWQWCEDKQRKQRVQTFIVLAFGALITALAVLALLYVLCCKGRLRERLDPRRAFGHNASEKDRPTEVVEVETDAGPVLEVIDLPQEPQEPARVSNEGTFRRAAEEGRGRTRIRFSPEHDGSGQAISNGEQVVGDGGADGARRVSGRQTNVEIGEQGNIRCRVPSGQLG